MNWAYIAGFFDGEGNISIRFTKDATKFLVKVLPQLRIKKAEAQDVLRFNKLYPPRSKGWWLKHDTSQKQARRNAKGRFQGG